MKYNGVTTFGKFKRKDHHFERMFGAAKAEPIIPLGRSVDGVPPLCQWEQPHCVPCTVAFAEEVLDPAHPALSPEFLAEICKVGSRGVEPQKVLNQARKTGICSKESYGKEFGTQLLDAYAHRIGGDARIQDLTPQGLYNALKKSPGIMVGVEDWFGGGPHMLWAYDVKDEKTLSCVSWSCADCHDKVEVPMKDVVYARTVYGDDNVPVKRFGFFGSFLANGKWINPKLALIIGGLLLTLLGLLNLNQQYGASGVYSRYRASLSRGISDTATSIYVNSLELKSGESIGQAGDTPHFPLYLTLQPESSEPEDIECWGVTTGTTPYFSGCVRGISYLGSSGTTSTVSGFARSHSAGEGIIMSNSIPFFNRFMDNWTEQIINGVKRFTGLIYVGDGTQGKSKIVFQQGQGDANPYIYSNGTSTVGYSPDGVSEFAFNASGTIVGASSTRGIFLTDSQVGIKLGSQNLTFDSNGNLVGYATGTAGEDIEIGDALVVSSTASNELFETNTANVYNTFKFVGFAATTTSDGGTVQIATPGTVLCAFTGLLPGTQIYLYGSDGAVSSTPYTDGASKARVARVGQALNSNCLRVAEPRYEFRDSFTAGAYVGLTEWQITTGFFPTHIKVMATVQDPDPGYVAGSHWSIGEITLPSTAPLTLINNSSSTNLFGRYNSTDWSNTFIWMVVTSTSNTCGSASDYQGNCAYVKNNSWTNDGFIFQKTAYSALVAIVNYWVTSD